MINDDDKPRKVSVGKKPYKRFEPRRKAVTRPIGEMVPGLTKYALGRYGFGQTALITDWHRIVGERLAKFCQPMKIIFPRGQRVGGVLHIKVVGPMALELQHMEPILIDRINTYFGYGAVTSIRLKQSSSLGAIRKNQQKEAEVRKKKVPLDLKQVEEISRGLENVENEEMRQILQRLGESVARRNLDTK